ncbi:cyclic pyranopterin monophosphate synthase subunit MoaA [Tamilnaduibacter salinus]|uniref:GTP 3',8-cyclase n=1 Tax=Tamilnaduibacter salinus TaxID=1484056 RepID=A0A2A2I5D5_9GAMM|nr:GTP 3',8-cyclase MoaA [Tamilnaduibacter salinus]PAV26608.1 GTP 3',8-cyclase MoaA [Tamilnaduibacter salinus]PVY75847.1 cyclic pyranopterin monophosphate synthase subunit MoaA [Tamilnaduibacter salinus]
MGTSQLVDRFGRTIRYVRLSVTDRCDFRCVYCMAEDMEFLPKPQILSLEELARVARSFVDLGTDKIRLTGGEPLVRRDVMELVREIGGMGLRDFTMTTNGNQLPRFADELRAAGLHRVNISLDSLDPQRFSQITRTGRLERVLDGIDAAREAGFPGIKLNTVILKGRNDDEVPELIEFARKKQIDISFIEEMPLGEISEHSRAESFCSSDEVRDIIRQRHELLPAATDTGGPSRYYRMPDSPIRVGFISPHSHNFCDTCNRVRLTVEGRLLLCLGNEHSVDLREVLRNHPTDDTPVRDTIIKAMDLKPERHHFSTDGDVQILRFMNMTGG